MQLLRLILVIFSSLFLTYQVNSFVTNLPTPIKIDKSKIDPIQSEAIIALKYLNAPEKKIQEYSKSISIASKATSLSPTLIACIIFTESGFDNKAISSKNYKGLMQTPNATFIYSDVDILHGARIFKDKLRISKGNYEIAMMLYKGGRNKIARKYAKETLRIYNNIKNNINNV